MLNQNKFLLLFPLQFFIKANGKLSDTEILGMLNLKGYEEVEFQEHAEHQFRIYISRFGEWIHVMDNMDYHLYHCLKGDLFYRNIDRINQIGRKYDLFFFSVGDSTNDLEFYYYQDKVLKRKFIYNENLEETVDKFETFGEPLEGEEQPEEMGRHIDYAHALTKSIGIHIEHNPEKIKMYSNLSMTKEEWYELYY